MPESNEGRICEAIICHLENREGTTRTNVRSPEAENHTNPVELVWNLGARLYAIEHTRIEPFEGHLKMDAEAPVQFGPITVELEQKLPDGVFELHVPVNAMTGRKKAEIRQIQRALIDWVVETARKLPVRRYADYEQGTDWIVADGVPFAVRLFRFESVLEGCRFQIRHSIMQETEGARRARIGAAFEKKFGKLAGWKNERQARTVLVLEENDIQITNHVVVAEVVLDLVKDRPDRPDEIYLVSTRLNNWSAWPLLIDDISLFDESDLDRDPRWEIEPGSLPAATKR